MGQLYIIRMRVTAGILMLLLIPSLTFGQAITIVSIKGDVKIRRGLEEAWAPVTVGSILKDMDSILTGENAEASLQIHQDHTFRLGPQAMLDMADLRRIDQREMFLLLMSEKINNIENRREKSRIRLGNVTVVHGNDKSGSAKTVKPVDAMRWRQEYNGARALYGHDYFTNAIVKLSKTGKRFPNAEDCGKISFLLGQSFAAIRQVGQAMEAYQASAEKIRTMGCNDSESLRRLQLTETAVAELRDTMP
ncbi:hypothetical protein JXO59_00255 [candidate division KSB1 bacterium]|nr:hypothetical protein [candidate division KSB1 bacterium]